MRLKKYLAMGLTSVSMVAATAAVGVTATTSYEKPEVATEKAETVQIEEKEVKPTNTPEVGKKSTESANTDVKTVTKEIKTTEQVDYDKINEYIDKAVEERVQKEVEERIKSIDTDEIFAKCMKKYVKENLEDIQDFAYDEIMTVWDMQWYEDVIKPMIDQENFLTIDEYNEFESQAMEDIEIDDEEAAEEQEETEMEDIDFSEEEE